MATQAHQALQKWHRIELLVQQWLNERQQLIMLLNSLPPLVTSSAQRNPLPQRIQEFCQLLMDYISAGYFEIYRELAEEARCLRCSDGLNTSILKRLDISTDAALAFNDDFDTAEHIRVLQHRLPQRLADLHAKLQERFALEDQLIVSIHHRNSSGVDHRRTSALGIH